MDLSIETTIAFIAALVALIGVIVSVFTLSNSAGKEAFAELKVVVEDLKNQLQQARDENVQLKIENAELRDRIDAQDSLISALKTQIEMDIELKSQK